MFLSNGFVRILTNFSRIFVVLHMLVMILITSKEVVIQSVSSAEQEFVKTRVRMGSKEVSSQSVSRTTSSVTTTTATMDESIQSTIKSVYDSATLEVLSDLLFDGISTLYDISCEHENMIKGKISREEFNKALVKRVMASVGSFVGSSLGMDIGQVVIPIPYVGSMVGSAVGGLVGSLMANMIANAVLA